MKQVFILAITFLVMPVFVMAQWSLTGNSGTIPSVNYIGTSDAQPLVFKINTKKAGRIELNSNIANTSLGFQTLNLSSPGNKNSAFGYQALTSNTGVGNTAQGYRSMYTNSSGGYNTALGYQSLYNNTTSFFNTAIGFNSLNQNTTGTSNVAIGVQALFGNISGSDNCATGLNTLYSNTFGSGNTATGFWAMFSNTTGQSNTADGNSALIDNETGSYNAAMGVAALTANTAGSYNTANGYQALYSNITGNYNTGLGYLANVIAGGPFSDATAIGANATVDASDKVRIGSSSVSVYSCEVNWTIGSDARIKDNVQENVPGLQFIKELRPVTFHYNVTKQNQLMGIVDTAKWASKYDIEKIAFTGFLAQDVDAAAEKIGYDFSGVDRSGKVMGLRYSEFVVPLVKAVQELSSENDSLIQQNQQQQEINIDLQKQLDDLKYSIVQMENAMREGSNSFQSSDSHSETIATVASMTDKTLLFQNTPNPFTQATAIGYFIPASAKNAQLTISDLSGKILKTFNIGFGKGQQVISGGELNAGIYQYALRVNGQLIDTKQMELLK
jgi:hypothetical protein